jgi:TRAP-type C4-dicarboxylate transport system permease small subunit
MTEKPPSRPLSVAGWIALAVLLGFFLVSLWYAARVWTSLSGVQMSGFGWTFLVLGVVVTIALGAGLMALVFYSARHDMDR